MARNVWPRVVFLSITHNRQSTDLHGRNTLGTLATREFQPITHAQLAHLPAIATAETIQKVSFPQKHAQHGTAPQAEFNCDVMRMERGTT